MEGEGAARGLNWAAAYFDSSGRTGRGAFVLKLAGLVVLLGAERILLDVLGFSEGARPVSLALRLVGAALGALLQWPVFIAGACILCQRLHDRGWVGWWAAPILLAALSFSAHPHGVAGFIALAILFMAALELALLPGQARFNRYGPRP